ncbi:RagB/SusD family nutrient uptake outer membrane protein [Sphingobacterium tabacisoli]|uniref:RagB/SusD family nutrient uptake outer membrane protein n=1 Tax=Sphingobacterium tabacisoli TaxID=2044855 RepID=A0ABW5KYX5_9SPHI|nr:RagB/SusD family nutrient uptake outer membrane protein [Sphingobacterium tabacisoli]
MKIKYLILLSCVFLFSACNKWLDVELADKVPQEKLFSTEQGYQEALAGVYSAMASENLYGKRLSMEVLDLLAQYYNYNSISADYEKLKAFDYKDEKVESTFLGIWNKLYTAISATNNIIYWAEKDVDVLTPKVKSQVLGEAYALRAYLHFDLVRLFAPDVKRSPKAQGIPYNTQFGVSLPPIYTVEQCVQLVMDDLREAERLLADDPIIGVKPYEMTNKNDADKYVARMNLFAVKGLMARVSLMRNDKNNAIKYAKEVIESNRFKLLNFASADKPDEEIDILFSDEHIFSLRNRKISDYSKALHFSSTPESGGSKAALLTFGSRFQWYEGNNDDIRNIKWFSTVDGSFMKFTVDNTKNIFRKMPMIKLSEMYLILAEAYLGVDDMRAQAYINELRNHRIRNNAPWGYLTMEYIFDELKREMVGEGQLWYVYKRLNLGIPINSGTIGVLPPSDDIFVFPMPRKEIENGHRN